MLLMKGGFELPQLRQRIDGGLKLSEMKLLLL